MDFERSAEQEALYQEGLALGRGALAAPDITARDRDGVFSPALWRVCAERGLLGAVTPAALGGRGLSLLDACMLAEGLGRGCPDAGLLFAAGAHLFGALPALEALADDAQRTRWLRPLARGEAAAALAVTEAGSGSSAFEMSARAVRDGADWVLSGEKRWVTNAPFADVLLIFARTGDGSALGAISCFVVPAGTPGLTAGPPEDLTGLRTCPVGSLTLDGCRVPAESLLGQEGGGALAFLHAMRWERVGLMAFAVGAMQRQLDGCARFVRRRRVGATPLSAHQAVTHRVAEMAARLEGARALVYRAAWRVDRGAAGADASIAKLATGEALVANALDAVRVHGAAGLRRGEVERSLRDAVMSTAYSGTADIQRALIAQQLGLRPPRAR